MNDRFRFRAWDKSFNKYCENVIVSTINKEITVYVRLVSGRTALIPNSHVVLEQCTGLKDKNGRLIYEGDIVKFKISTVKCVGAVRWDERTGGWLKDKTGQPLHTYIKSVEVIGNIHENP